MCNNTDNLTADSKARRRVTTELDKNFFVEAGAGSGKTTLLVERMAAMVKGGTDIKQIAAITFTKAAAREFYRRFQKKLFEESRNAPLPEQRERCASALADIDLCFMDTIDAFCQTIMLEHPVETGIHFGSGVISDDDRTLLCRDMLRAVHRGDYDVRYPGLRGLYEEMARWYQNPERAVVIGLDDFLRIRGSALYKPEDTFADLDRVFGDFKIDLYTAAETLAEHKEYADGAKTYTSGYDNLIKKRSLLTVTWNNGSNMEKVSGFLNSLSKLRLLYSPQDILPSAAGFFTLDTALKRDVKYKLRPELLSAPAALYRSVQYSAYVRFMERFAAAAADEMRERGLLGFSDFLRYLRDSLRRDAENGGSLIEHITRRHSCFLIDEFQDTDPMQAEIFFLLSAQEPCADWRRSRPRPGSLFIVGDPKQSIYRFKGADIDSFLAVRSRFLGDDRVGDTLTLYRNFRSAPVLRDWFNGRFAELFPPSDTGTENGVEFSAIPANEDDGMHTGGLFEGVFGYDANNKAEGMTYTANIIKTITHNDRCLIYDRRAEKARPIEYSDIMVITYNTKHLREFAKVLTEHGIPFYAEGATDFSGQRELAVMRDAFGAFSAPADKSRVYAALAGPVFGLTDVDIYEYKKAGGNLTLVPPPDDMSAAARAMRRLGEIRLSINELSPYSAFIRAAEMLGVFGLDGIDYKRREYFWYAAELLRAGEAEGSVRGIGGVYSFLTDLLTNRVDRDPILDPDRSLVHIANLHKVKGLEAPVVILLNGVHMQRSYNVSTDRSCDPASCVILGMSRDGETACELPADSPEEILTRAAREFDQAREEDKRLEYVAATRAGSALIIGRSAKPGKYVPCWELLLEKETVPLGLEGIAAGREHSTDDLADTHCAAVPLDRLLAECPGPSFIRVLPSDLKAPKKDVFDNGAGAGDVFSDRYEDEDGGDNEDGGNTGRSDGALIGTLVHRAMELFVLSGFGYSPEQLSRAVLSEYTLSQECSRVYGNIIRNVAKTILRGGYMQSGGYPSDIMGELKAADKILCETPFCVRDEEASSEGRTVLADGVIDLMYRKDGVWHIVDYKTGRVGSGLETVYAGQLEAYRNAFKKACGEDAETHIYHIDIT